MEEALIAFGPVPSRRLGRSLGINNIPHKACTYSCVYCQVGRAVHKEIDRRQFYKPDELERAVSDKTDKAERKNEPIDYLTFVPDGEPTLDINLGLEINLLRSLGFKIGVITNGSLLWREDVRAELMNADWVSIKVDSVIEKPWYTLNRPHMTLQLETLLNGMMEFAHTFGGMLVTETMLVRDINDTAAGIEAVSDFLAILQPDISYLAVPTRPPAEKHGQPPEEEVINRSYQQISRKQNRVELLVGYEGSTFASTGNAGEDLLSITAVHPMRRDAVEDLLKRSNADWAIVDDLIFRGDLVETEYGGKTFYLRKFR